MATDINIAALTGRLTKDCEFTTTPSGAQLAKIQIAVNRWSKNGGKVSYFDCIIWGQAAQSLHAYLLKGTAVAVKGHLDQERWKDGDGKSRSKVQVVTEDIKLLGGGKGNGEAAGTESGYSEEYEDFVMGKGEEDGIAEGENVPLPKDEEVPF